MIYILLFGIQYIYANRLFEHENMHAFCSANTWKRKLMILIETNDMAFFLFLCFILIEGHIDLNLITSESLNSIWTVHIYLNVYVSIYLSVVYETPEVRQGYVRAVWAALHALDLFFTAWPTPSFLSLNSFRLRLHPNTDALTSLIYLNNSVISIVWFCSNQSKGTHLKSQLSFG